ncbi:venom phosphodiesterase 2 isoform X1 [Selaginella moellendorffii]|nr:venom phosphodiesterase 2 isoform X1 [Selaginella moellendorffii]|eukprot:XP_002973640.2 venom phosphodiesterase 2 isoform X1 [Selaginella moellendorffii]
MEDGKSKGEEAQQRGGGGAHSDEVEPLVAPDFQLQALGSRFARCICFAAGSLGVMAALVLAFVVVLSTQHRSASSSEISRPLRVLDKPLVILISSDGFRWGYQWKVPTPNIDRLISNGTEAFPGMIPVYPSVTFPNHYSIATGLYPAWHGIVANYFRDPVRSSNETFFMGNLNAKWWIGEPIWETVVKNGLEAAVYFWPGSQVVRKSWPCRPEICPSYNKSVPFEERVDAVLGYLDLPQRPSFIGLYFEEPDEEGHQVGPDAPQISAAITRVDSMIGMLLEGLEKRNILEEVTIIMVGDHGMVGTCDKKLIFLEDLERWIQIPKEWVDSTSPVLAITPPLDVDAKVVVEKMKQGLASGSVANGEFLQVYLKEDLPSRLHYSASDRIQPIIGMVEEGYKVELTRPRKTHTECGGAHGYDNLLVSMRTIFIGHGPQFARGKKVPSFVNVEVYNVIATILGLNGTSNNGTTAFPQSILLSK